MRQARTAPARPDRMFRLGITLFVTTTQLALITAAGMVIPVAAPAMAPVFGIDLALLGAYSSTVYILGTFSNYLVGSLIARYAAVRVTQIVLTMAAMAMMVALPGGLAALVVSALLLGMFGTISGAPATDMLARVSTPRSAALVFSIKQSGQPLGGVLAGIAVPALIVAFGWRGPFVALATVLLLSAVAMQPMRGRYDGTPDPAVKIRFGNMGETFRAVFHNKAVAVVGVAVAAYCAVQIAFTAYAVAYLVDRLGYSLAVAGGLFAAAQAVAVVGRILWGVVGARFDIVRPLFGALGPAMALSAAAFAVAAPEWPLLAVGIAGGAMGVTAVAWHGLMFTEIVRLAEEKGEIGVLTGGVVGLSCFGAFVGPLAFALILKLTASYAAAFIVTALPAAVAGLAVILQGSPTSEAALESRGQADEV